MTELLDCGHAPDEGQTYGHTGRKGWTFVLDFDGKRKICRACADARILDCGHAPSPHEAFSTGYGTDSAGKTLCYACCAARDRADMIATGRTALYLQETDGSRVEPFTSRDRMRVTNWPGSLSFPVTHFRKSRNGGGFGSQRTDAWFAGPDGYIWHAVNRGDNDIARCKRTKERA